MLRLFRHLRPYAWPVVAALVLILMQSLAELYLPTLMANIVDVGIRAGDARYIMQTGGRMLLVAVLGMVCAVGAGYLSARISAGFGKGLREEVFSRVETFSLREFDKFGTASLITRTTNDITQIQMVVLMSLRMVASAPIMAVGGIIMAVSMDPRLSLTLIWVLPVLTVLMAAAIVKGMPLFKAIQQKIDRLNLVLRENLTGIRVVRAFNRMEHEANRFDVANRDLTETNLRVARIVSAMMPLIMLTLNFTTIALIWIGSRRIDAGNLAVGGLMAFIQYAMRILFSLLNISFIFIMFPRAAASADRINEVLDSVAGIADPHKGIPGIAAAIPLRDTKDNPKPNAVDAVRSPNQEGCTESPEAARAGRGVVEFRNVTFSYPGAEQPVLRNVSFVAEPGKVTAIIGGTGSGKSTLVNLIPRFYDADSGSVLVDGVDVKDMAQKDLRSLIGFVPQKAVLFTGTIAENIRYGKDDATDDEIARALEVAQALKFVGDTADNFRSQVSQGGANYSGGQKQRLSIARAIVRKPAIYILDDSFSALDFRTDAKLRSALRKETGDATVIIVAQRVSTIMDADRILVLDGGRIVGNGAHKELMKTCDIYREIVCSQLSEEEIA